MAKISNFKTGYAEKKEFTFDGAKITLKRADAEFHQGLMDILRAYDEKLDKKEEKRRDDDVAAHYSTLIVGWDNLIYKDNKVPFSKKNAEILALSGVRFQNWLTRNINNVEGFATEEQLKFEFDLKN